MHFRHFSSSSSLLLLSLSSALLQKCSGSVEQCRTMNIKYGVRQGRVEDMLAKADLCSLRGSKGHWTTDLWSWSMSSILVGGRPGAARACLESVGSQQRQQNRKRVCIRMWWVTGNGMIGQSGMGWLVWHGLVKLELIEKKDVMETVSCWMHVKQKHQNDYSLLPCYKDHSSKKTKL